MKNTMGVVIYSSHKFSEAINYKGVEFERIKQRHKWCILSDDKLTYMVFSSLILWYFKADIRFYFRNLLLLFLIGLAKFKYLVYLSKIYDSHLVEPY